jgi:hypothetical protein
MRETVKTVVVSSYSIIVLSQQCNEILSVRLACRLINQNPLTFYVFHIIIQSGESGAFWSKSANINLVLPQSDCRTTHWTVAHGGPLGQALTVEDMPASRLAQRLSVEVHGAEADRTHVLEARVDVLRSRQRRHTGQGLATLVLCPVVYDSAEQECEQNRELHDEESESVYGEHFYNNGAETALEIPSESAARDQKNLGGHIK